MKIVTSEQMQQIEQECAKIGVSTDMLMENAGKAVAEEVRQILGTIDKQRIPILVGPGNNGGDRLVDYCLPILNKIGDNIESVEDNIFSNEMPRAIKEISILRRDVISFRRIIWPMRAVIASLEPKIRRFTKMDMAVYFGDMVDHVDKIWDGLDEYKEIIEGLNDTHDSLATNRTNEVIRMLTIIATILLPITMVASIYGMNIPLPFQHSSYSLLFVFLIMLAIISGMLYFFRRQHWI